LLFSKGLNEVVATFTVPLEFVWPEGKVSTYIDQRIHKRGEIGTLNLGVSASGGTGTNMQTSLAVERLLNCARAYSGYVSQAILELHGIIYLDQIFNS